MAHPNPSDPADLIPPTDPISTTLQEIRIVSHESRVSQALGEVSTYNSKLAARMHKFPASLQGFGEERGYIVPKMVAIGPYHRHRPELQAMEMVKKTVPQFFCTGASVEAYEKLVVDVAGAARSFYEAESLEGISDTGFASMMFHDGCYLLATILATESRIEPDLLPVLCGAVANTPVVLTDMFLLENQIPWVVLEALMTLRKVNFSSFIAKMGMNVQSRIDRQVRPLELRDHKPSHLLGLFRFYQSGDPLPLERNWENGSRRESPRVSYHDDVLYLISSAKRELSGKPEPTASVLEKLPLGTSAIELAEIGIKLTLSKTAEFKDIGLTEGPLFRKIFLPSLRLNENTACWLLNMAAFEVCVALHDREYIVSSYLALFAMFMHREEDVHELRAKRLIHGEFTNKQTLDFFKGRHAGNLRPGRCFYSILRRLERYKQRCGLWIAIHKFVYNNVKTILAVLSIIGVLAGIFKALLYINKQ